MEFIPAAGMLFPAGRSGGKNTVLHLILYIEICAGFNRPEVRAMCTRKTKKFLAKKRKKLLTFGVAHSIIMKRLYGRSLR